MITAGLGCRRGCPAAEIVTLVRQAGPVDMLAAPAWKQDEPGLLEAARLLGLPLRFVEDAEMAAVQARCVTRSAVVARAVGVASVAEAAALANGATLVRPRFGSNWATCALARCDSSPPPLEGGGRGKGCPHAQSPASCLSPRPPPGAASTPPPTPPSRGGGRPCTTP